MRKMKQIMATLACAMLVLTMAIPVSAEAGAVQRAQGTTICDRCGATATHEGYRKIGKYVNGTAAGHEEVVEALYYCAKRHLTVRDVNIGIQSHSYMSYDDLGHTGPESETHQYWVKCPCGYGENVYVGCNSSKTGVHTKPF